MESLPINTRQYLNLALLMGGPVRTQFACSRTT
jgi:hypothetical protein